jgi:hypothetical protein
LFQPEIYTQLNQNNNALIISGDCIVSRSRNPSTTKTRSSPQRHHCVFKGSFPFRGIIGPGIVRQGDIVDNVEVRSFLNRLHSVLKGRTDYFLSDNVSAWKGIKAHKISFKNRDNPQSFTCLLKSFLFFHHDLIGVCTVNDNLVATYPCDRKDPREGMTSWRHIAQGFWESTLKSLFSSLIFLLGSCLVCPFKKPHSPRYLCTYTRKQDESRFIEFTKLRLFDEEGDYRRRHRLQKFFDLHKCIFSLLFSLRNAAPLVLLWLLAQR